MRLPQHNPVVFYSEALSTSGFIVLVVLPLVVLGLIMWWADEVSKR